METTQKSQVLPEKWEPCLKFGLWLFPHGYVLNLFGLWIQLGIKNRMPKDVAESWALSYSDNRFMPTWGTKSKVIYMPWDFIVSHKQVITNKDTLVPIKAELNKTYKLMLNKRAFGDDRAIFSAPYQYIKKGINGSPVPQFNRAAFYVTMTEYRMRIFRRMGIGPKKMTSEINVTFKSPIGEGAGTAMGGRSRCTFRIESTDNSPFDTLNRMALTRKFE